MEISELSSLSEREILIVLCQEHKTLNKALIDHMKEEEKKFEKIEKEQNFVKLTLCGMGFIGVAINPGSISYMLDLILKGLH